MIWTRGQWWQRAATVARETRKGLSEKVTCKLIPDWQEGNVRDSQPVSEGKGRALQPTPRKGKEEHQLDTRDEQCTAEVPDTQCGGPGGGVRSGG